MSRRSGGRPPGSFVPTSIPRGKPPASGRSLLTADLAAPLAPAGLAHTQAGATGVLGRAQRLYPLEVSGFTFLSTHYHLTLWVPDAKRLADFMEYFQSNLAREVCRLHGWKDKVWSRRYSAIVISNEETAQVGTFSDVPNQFPRQVG